MKQKLSGKRVAVLATDGYEASELDKPVEALKDAGAMVQIISLKSGSIQGMKHNEKDGMVDVDALVSDVSASDFHALVLPGGVANPDTLRIDKNAVKFVHDFFEQGKPVGAICHGPWMLVEADVLQGRTVTSWPSIKTDIINAGGNWVDEEVCVDAGLVTSRKPDDLKAFCAKIVEEFAEGKHEGQAAA
jgi:protease I